MRRQAIDPFDEKSLAAFRFDRRSGERAVVTPQFGRSEITMQARFEAAHLDAVIRQRWRGRAGKHAPLARFRNSRNRQRIDERLQRTGIECRRRRRLRSHARLRRTREQQRRRRGRAFQESPARECHRRRRFGPTRKACTACAVHDLGITQMTTSMRRLDLVSRRRLARILVELEPIERRARTEIEHALDRAGDRVERTLADALCRRASCLR